jgi:hypothetical protein
MDNQAQDNAHHNRLVFFALVPPILMGVRSVTEITFARQHCPSEGIATLTETLKEELEVHPPVRLCLLCYPLEHPHGALISSLVARAVPLLKPT